jgi:primosomal protein N'
LLGTYAYAIEERHAARVEPGSRVVVPVRGRRVIGVVTEVNPPLDPARKYHAVLEAPDEQPSLTPALLATCQWISRYTAPPGLVLRAALPALLTGAGKPAPEPQSRRIASIGTPLATSWNATRSSAGRQNSGRPRAPRVVRRRVPVEHLEHQLGVSSSVIAALARRGLVTIEREVTMRDAFARRPRDPMVSLEPTAPSAPPSMR